eukprot:TRINITY_DN1170_c0_g1_i1.p1 TRINITY_DN1170_c0_g1~~TRINITY_DN1170_c0_g1_i1.p1  ORF type:complete len:665 (+),score=82.81 TRINITY_DN1170_c0_g1_i1:177-2171(+)
MAENGMAENGDENLIAVARHIAKTLGRTDTMTDDILQIFSTFDGRFSREKLSEKNEGDDSRSFSGLERTLKSLDRQISRFIVSERPIWSDSANSTAFLDAIDELIATIRDWDPAAGEKSVAACLATADDLLQQAMFRLEDEFRSLMERSGESFDVNRYVNSDAPVNFLSDSDEGDGDDEDEDEDRIPIARPLADYDIVIDPLPSGTISDLHEIAKRMVAAGFGKECTHVYSSCRREFLEESVSRLGLQKLSIEEVQKMSWTDLEDEIERWGRAVTLALRILFPSERRLCDRVFSGLTSTVADLSFMEVCRGSAIQILNFADAVAIGGRAPERLFRVLDMFETLRDLMPEFETVFSDQYSSSIRTEAVTIWKRIGEAVRGIFMELENLIRRDPAKAAVPGGGLHPITRYVMNYLRAACGSRQTLEQIFEDNISIGGAAGGGGIPGSDSSSSSLSVQIAWIMELLESNLEAKSKVYRDQALSSVFLMNNGRYIVQKARNSELGLLLGDDWIRKHTAKVRQCHVNYQRSSWSKVVALLKLEGSSSAANTSSNNLKTVRERFRAFNSHFDEICRAQSEWVIVDEQLRTELRINVSGNVAPAYRNFLGRLQSVLEAGKHVDKYVKYTVDDVEERINELFQGSNGSVGVGGGSGGGSGGGGSRSGSGSRK